MPLEHPSPIELHRSKWDQVKKINAFIFHVISTAIGDWLEKGYAPEMLFQIVKKVLMQDDDYKRE